jgi:hypothetical protein
MLTINVFFLAAGICFAQELVQLYPVRGSLLRNGNGRAARKTADSSIAASGGIFVPAFVGAQAVFGANGTFYAVIPDGDNDLPRSLYELGASDPIIPSSMVPEGLLLPIARTLLTGGDGAIFIGLQDPNKFSPVIDNTVIVTLAMFRDGKLQTLLAPGDLVAGTGWRYNGTMLRLSYHGSLMAMVQDENYYLHLIVTADFVTWQDVVNAKNTGLVGVSTSSCVTGDAIFVPGVKNTTDLISLFRYPLAGGASMVKQGALTAYITWLDCLKSGITIGYQDIVGNTMNYSYLGNGSDMDTVFVSGPTNGGGNIRNTSIVKIIEGGGAAYVGEADGSFGRFADGKMTVLKEPSQQDPPPATFFEISGGQLLYGSPSISYLFQ